MSGREKYCKNLMCRAIDEATKQLGYAELRPNQALVVKSFLEGRDIVSVPTVSGKALCYCLLPDIFDILRGSNLVEMQSVFIVVSLLVALMKDEMRQMTERNMRPFMLECLHVYGSIHSLICFHHVLTHQLTASFSPCLTVIAHFELWSLLLCLAWV